MSEPRDKMFDHLERMFDIFFNGASAEPAKKPAVTIDELIRRSLSYVSYGGKLYRVKVTEVEITK